MTMLVERGVPVPMRDGVNLIADVYRPADDRAPALLQRTPYGADLPPICRPANGLRLVDSGYAVVVQDVRGRGRSEGRFDPFVQEAADGEDTVAWLRGQAWWDGGLGMLGSSYSGYLQWSLAERMPKEVRAIAPHVAGPDPAAWFGRNGAHEWGFGLWWSLAAHAIAEAARDEDGGRAEDEVWATLNSLDGAYRRGPDDLPDVIDRIVRYARGWLQTPQSVPGAVSLEELNVPSLLIGGWHDIFLEQTLAAFRTHVRAGAPARLVVGPWSHTVWTGQFPQRDYGRFAAMEAEDITRHHLDWFDRWIRDEGEEQAPVRFFMMGTDAWEDAAGWPPPGVREDRWRLAWDGAGVLNSAAGESHLCEVPLDAADPVPTLAGQTLMAGTYAARRAGPWDVGELLDRTDVICFATEPLQRALEIVGTVRLEVLVAAPHGGDLACALLDLGPDGEAMHVLDGILRIDAVAHERMVGVTLGTTAIRVEPLHRLVLTVARSNFPRFDLNEAGPVVLHLEDDRASNLVLPNREPQP